MTFRVDMSIQGPLGRDRSPLGDDDLSRIFPLGNPSSASASARGEVLDLSLSHGETEPHFESWTGRCESARWP